MNPTLPIVVVRCQQIEYLIMIIGTLYYTNRQSFDTCGWYLFSIVVSIDYMRKENTNSLFVFSPTYTFAEKFLSFYNNGCYMHRFRCLIWLGSENLTIHYVGLPDNSGILNNS